MSKQLTLSGAAYYKLKANRKEILRKYAGSIDADAKKAEKIARKMRKVANKQKKQDH